MKPAGMVLLNLLVVVAALAIYHLVFHGDGASGGGGGEQALRGSDLEEREALDSQLQRAQDVFLSAYDEAEMRGLVEKAGLSLTPEQAQEVLPMLHAHLVALRHNLQAARDAVLAGKPKAQRGVYRARAAQLHAAFHGKLRTILTPEDATALFKACPAMMPGVPGSAAPGNSKPKAAPPPVVTHQTPPADRK